MQHVRDACFTDFSSDLQLVAHSWERPNSFPPESAQEVRYLLTILPLGVCTKMHFPKHSKWPDRTLHETIE
jgi:hypothetical protein